MKVTCIVGYKSQDGELFIAADCRVSWRFSNPNRPTVHIDDLQKLYFPTPNVVIAFAGDRIDVLKNILSDFSTLANEHFNEQIINDRTNYEYNNSISRLLRRHLQNVVDNTEILVGISFPNRAEHNKLFYYHILNNRIIDEREINNREYIAAGSVVNEPHYNVFQSNVLDLAFNLKKAVDISNISGFFNTNFRCFYDRLPQKWGTVGNLFHSVYTQDGIFIGYDTETETIIPTKARFRVAMIYDHTRRCFIQRDLNSGVEVELIPIDKYIFHPETQDRVFTLTPIS